MHMTAIKHNACLCMFSLVEPLAEIHILGNKYSFLLEASRRLSNTTAFLRDLSTWPTRCERKGCPTEQVGWTDLSS